MTNKPKSYKVIKTNLELLSIDPFDPIYWDKPLWVVYGYECFPSIVCLKINNASGVPNVWGYSIYGNSAGFRTLGQGLQTWIDEKNMILFFDDRQNAMSYLNHLITPKATSI